MWWFVPAVLAIIISTILCGTWHLFFYVCGKQPPRDETLA